MIHCCFSNKNALFIWIFSPFFFWGHYFTTECILLFKAFKTLSSVMSQTSKISLPGKKILKICIFIQKQKFHSNVSKLYHTMFNISVMLHWSIIDIALWNDRLKNNYFMSMKLLHKNWIWREQSIMIYTFFPPSVTGNKFFKCFNQFLHAHYNY